MAVSIADVADMAKVSISTVSRVINGHNIVNETTRKRVETAIAKLGYRPNVFARGLMINRSNILSLVLPDLHGEFYSEIIRGANLKARETGVHLMVSSLTKEDLDQVVLSTLCGNGLADGVVVMISEAASKSKKFLEKVAVPLVILNADVKFNNVDCVTIDQREGAVSLMDHLLSDRSLRRVVFVGGPKTNIDSKVRFSVYQEKMAAAGLPIAPDDVFHLDFQYDSAFSLASKKVQSWAGSDCCVFAANDEMAAGIMHACISAGLSIPSDLRIVGFDDTRLARLVRPSLTTVRVPMSEMGAAAIESLMKRIENPQASDAKITLRPELVVRESCGIVQQ